MPRSIVLTGKINARDRAQGRHRHDRRAEGSPPDPCEQLRGWLDASGPARLAEAQRYDLVAFLRETGSIDLPSHERLRQLAIHLERSLPVETPLQAWLILERVYEGAKKLAPDDLEVWISRGVSAVSLLELAWEEGRVASRIYPAGLRALQRALEIDPRDAHAPFVMGTLVYVSDGDERTEAALDWFERAIVLDPAHAAALLYRAHCLHDLERWREAAEAYRLVPLGAFEGPQAWKVDLVVESRAYCLLRAGDRESALREFETLLERMLREPGRARYAPLPYLTRVARGVLAPELGARFAALEARL